MERRSRAVGQGAACNGLTGLLVHVPEMGLPTRLALSFVRTAPPREVEEAETET
jgi:hypothetical protein